MKRLLLSVVLLACGAFAAPVVVARGYGKGSGYNRFKSDEKVVQKMVEYWSRPDVLPYLPEDVKDKVEEYISQFPQYHYRPPKQDSSRSSSPAEPQLCKTQ